MPARKRRFFVRPVLVLLLMLGQTVCFAFESPDGVTVPETLSIKVGYFGDEFRDKALITRAELEAMTQYEGYYTYITRVDTVMLQYAKGPTVKDVLEYAGVSTDTVGYLNFWCADTDGHPFISSKSKASLLDVTAYYFPNLRDNWSGGAVTDETAARAGATAVPAVLAVWEYSTKNPNKTPTAADMTIDNSFRLCAGQFDVSTVTSFESAKWIYRIDVQLEGRPPDGVTIESGATLSLPVGSNRTLSYRLTGTDIAEGAKTVAWSSSDAKTVSVDANGVISVLAQGYAVITATTVNGKTASIHISAYEEVPTTTSVQIAPAETTSTAAPVTEQTTVAPPASVTERASAESTTVAVQSTSSRAETTQTSSASPKTTKAISVTNEVTTTTAAFAENEITTVTTVKGCSYREISVLVVGDNNGAADGGFADSDGAVEITDTGHQKKLAVAYCLLVFLTGAAYRVKKYRQEL